MATPRVGTGRWARIKAVMADGALTTEEIHLALIDLGDTTATLHQVRANLWWMFRRGHVLKTDRTIGRHRVLELAPHPPAPKPRGRPRRRPYAPTP